MVPMGVPEVPGVGASEAEGGDHSTFQSNVSPPSDRKNEVRHPKTQWLLSDSRLAHDMTGVTRGLSTDFEPVGPDGMGGVKFTQDVDGDVN